MTDLQYQPQQKRMQQHLMNSPYIISLLAHFRSTPLLSALPAEVEVDRVVTFIEAFMQTEAYQKLLKERCEGALTEDDFFARVIEVVRSQT